MMMFFFCLDKKNIPRLPVSTLYLLIWGAPLQTAPTRFGPLCVSKSELLLNIHMNEYEQNYVNSLNPSTKDPEQFHSFWGPSKCYM